MKTTPDYIRKFRRYLDRGHFGDPSEDEKARLAERKNQIGLPAFPRNLKNQIKKEKKKLIAKGLQIGKRRNREKGIITALDFEIMALNRAMAKIEYHRRHAKLIREVAQKEEGYYHG